MMKGIGLNIRSPYIIGVDIGSADLKVIGVRMTDPPQLLFYSITHIPKESGESHIAEAIKKVLSDNKVTAKDAVLTFTDEATVIRRLELPQVATDEVIDALKWQVKDMVHFDIDKGCLGFEVKGAVQKEDGSKHMQLLFAGLPREAVDRKVKILKDSGLNVVSVSMSPFGLESVFKLRGEAKGVETSLVVDFGNTRTEVSIFKGDILEFVRTIPIGSGDISTAITAGLITDKGRVEFSKEESDEVKRNFGISYEPTMLDKGVSSTQVLSLMRPVLERFSKEIRRSIDYYVQEFGGEEIGAVYLVGGGANLKNLDRFLTEELNIPVRHMEIPRAVNISKAVTLNEEDSLSIIPLIGLAAGYKKHLNLLPHEYAAEKMEFVENVSLRLVAIAAGLVLLTSFLFIKLKIDDYKGQLKHLRLQKNILNQVKGLRDTVSEKEVFLKQVQRSELPFEYVMKELSNIIPNDVVLESMNIKGSSKTLDMKGIVFEPRGFAEDILTSFMEGLEKSRYFKDAELVSVQSGAKTREELSNFEIACSLE